jgi:ABC-type antimicrobial peptide transport system permease subunit
MQNQLQRTLTAADLGLRLRPITSAGFLSVESESLILEDPVVRAVEASASELGLVAAPTLVYLINELNAANRSDDASRFSMYSIAAGLDFHQPEPLGPFRLADGSPVPELADNEIVLSDWVATDLQVKPGDTVQARWHEVGSHGDLPETHRSFVVRGVLPAEDPVSVNPDLTPFVEGVTNVNTFADWDQPFEMQMDRITARDDAWWEEHRAAPKSFVSRKTAGELWSSRFGRATSIRIASPGTVLEEDRLQSIANRLAADVPGRIAPVDLGLFIRPVRAEGLQASMGANDFSQLFLGFSGFLILSAILLAALMFQLSVRARVRQFGLLTAVGFTRRRARWLFTAEGMVVALCGAVFGAVLSAYCAQLLITALTTWWSGAVGTQFLRLELQPLRMLIAAGSTLVMAAVVLSLAVRNASRCSPREMLAGLTTADQSVPTSRWRGMVMTFLLFVSGLAAIGLPAAVLAGVLPSGEAFAGLTWQVVAFFVAGLACLTTGLLLLRLILARRTSDGVESGIRSLSGLAVANAARSPQRSLLTTALIGFATFVIVAVAAGRRNPVSELPDRKTGNGGFTLVGESSLPVLFDLNSTEGRLRLGINSSPAATVPDNTRVFGFRVKPGQDASCLNLFQATVPTLLGATPDFIERGGFRFASTPGENPWTQLAGTLPEVPLTAVATNAAEAKTLPPDPSEAPEPPAASSAPMIPAIPVIGDMNTLQFSLKKKIGDVILMPDDQQPQFALQIVGMLDSSIFQGVLVMSEANLQRVDSTVSGFRYFLIETADAAGSVDQTAAALETALQSSGFDTERVSRRLADFLAVQNTYLTTFQMLGGLGLLIGTFGLAVVMLRNVLERRAEIALLRSLGFRSSRLAWLVLLENGLLLLWGLLTGTVAALVAMLPHLISTGADVPWLELAVTLALVAAVGTLAAVLPVRASWRVPIREVLSHG